jgi:CRP-like cAMP-binding protein
MKYLKKFPKGEAIITEGESKKEFFCLINGTVSIWKGSCEGENCKEVKLGDISDKGAYFGEMSYFLNEPRTATVKCETDVKVLCFPGEMLTKLMKQQPDLAVKMCQDLASRLKVSSSMSHQEALGKRTMRTDAADQGLYAKESFQKVFVMLSAIQMQFQNPLLKHVIEYMGKNKLIHGGKKIQFSDEEMHDFPLPLVPLIKKLHG